MTNNKMIECLCLAVEKSAGFKMASPSDFDRLSSLIFEWQHITISTSTLRRIWGYAGQTTVPRTFTLDTLARFAGNKDFEAFCQSQGEHVDVQSQLFLSDSFTVDMLNIGSRLHLSWQPDRVCIIEYQGNGVFKVVKAENTKLQEGDTFECHLFINHEPLYIDRLKRGNLPPMSYVAGRIDGVTIRRLNKAI